MANLRATTTAFVLPAITSLAEGFDYSTNFAAGDTRSWGELRTTTSPTTLRHLISNIVCICTEKEMCRINTNGIIAFMQNMERFIKATVSKFITDPMRRSITTIKPKLTVQSGFATTCFALPLPALIVSFFVYFRPKSGDISLFHNLSITQPRGVF